MDQEADRRADQEHPRIPGDAPAVVPKVQRDQRAAAVVVALGPGERHTIDRGEPHVLHGEVGGLEGSRLELSLAGLLVGLLRQVGLHRPHDGLHRGGQAGVGFLPGLPVRVAFELGVRKLRHVLPGGLHDPSRLRASGPQVHRRLEALGPEPEDPQGREEHHPSEERCRQDEVPHRSAEHGREHQQHAPHEQHEGHRHGEAALHERATLHGEPQAGIGSDHGGLLVVGGDAGGPNSSTAALVASGLMHTLCSNVTRDSSWMDTT